MDCSTNKIRIPSPLETIEHFSSNFDQVLFKRDDLIHPLVGGNKWRKLCGLLNEKTANQLITMGGPHSNHIAASAAFASIFNFKIKALIRETGEFDTPTLNFAKSQGMAIEILNRTDYRAIRRDHLPNKKNTIFIPEGGAGPFATSGLNELADELRIHVDQKTIVALAAGTGCTAQNLVRALSPKCSFFIYPAGKRFGIRKQLERILTKKEIQLCHFPPESSLREYAEVDRTVWNFIEQFEIKFGVPQDPIYTGPMLKSILQNRDIQLMLTPFSRLIVYHSGGLQGREAYRAKL